MSSKPVVFVSAVSRELHSARDLVAKTLLSLGYQPKWQDIAPSESGDLSATLRKWIDDSAAVVQLVGRSYGREPAIADPQFGRVSYTQYEALYARRRGKKVWFILLDENHPTDPCEAETGEKQELQTKYRERICGFGDIYHTSSNLDQTEKIVLRVRDDLAKLRRRSTFKFAIVISLLSLIIVGGVWSISRQGKQENKLAQIETKTDKLLAAVHELSPTLTQLGQIGDKDSEQARLARAYDILEGKLKLQRGTLAKELPQFAEQLLQRGDTRVMDRASALFALKRFADAEAAALQAKDKALAAAGRSAKDAVAALELAGSAARAQIHYSRSLEHYRAAAALTSQQRDPIEWARVQHNIAYVVYDQGDYRQAAEVLRPVIEIRQRSLGPEHPDTLYSRNNLANALLAQGKPAEAEAEHRAILAIRQRVLGPNDPDTLHSRINLALAEFDQANYSKAEAECRAVLTIMERVFGPTHRDALAGRGDLGNMLYDQGKYAEAEEEYRAVLGSMRRVLGPEHSDTLICRNNLALMWDAQGKHAEAEVEFRVVLDITQRVLGPEHPSTLYSRNNLANALEAQGKHAEAEAEYRGVLGIIQRVLGPEHPDTFRIRNNLASGLEAQRKYAEAESEYRAVLAIQERVIGPEHPDVFGSYYNLAHCLEAQGRKPEALVLARRALAGFQKTLGEDHPYTKNAKHQLEALEK
jgi:tetratricopeptide (TPR) repeat protein